MTDAHRQLAVLMFTDIVDSVGLQKRMGSAAFATQIRRHDELFRQVMTHAEGGRVLQHTGDGFLISFTTASEAVEAALRLQFLFTKEAWPAEAMELRIGLHLGEIYQMTERNTSEVRPVGMATNLAARIMGLADARQILMLRAVYDDARQYVRTHPSIEGVDEGALATPVWLSHGAFSIKGHDEEVEVFEVGVEGIAPLSPPASSEKAKRADDTGSSPTAFELIRPEVLQGSDVLLNYASIDDQPLFDGKLGWVSELHRNLQIRVEQLSGQKVKIARLAEHSVEPEKESEIFEHLAQIKAMVSVVSPPFIQSEVCQREVECFWREAEKSGGRWVADKARLLKVLKTAVAQEEMPPPLADIFSPLLGFEFFEKDPESGRVREFDESFGPALKQRFFERVYDLAYDISIILKMGGSESVRPAHATTQSNGTRHRVFLATTTSDTHEQRDQIRRELLERGHQVVPESPLPMMATDLETTVTDALSGCSIAVHLLGKHYGMTPEDSAESLPALQLRLTAKMAKNQDLQRLVWMPDETQVQDQRQRDFLTQVQEDVSLQHRAELIEGNLNLLKQDLIRCLTPPDKEENPSASEAESPAGGTPKLYLICDPKDETQVESLEDYLFDQGLEVCLPAFDGDDAEAAALHQENLLTCDAVLVYFGAAPKAWVEIKLRELLKATGYGRKTPIRVQGVYVAPPEDRRKERFRSHQAKVIRQPNGFIPGADLDNFVSEIKEISA